MDFDHEFPVVILQRHLDLFGHVNNAAYLQLFEEARWDWITRNGFGVGVVRERGIGPTILDIHVRFKRELKEGDKVVIRTRTVDYRGKIGRVVQLMALPDGTTACSAEFKIALFDLKARRLIDPTPEWLRAVEAP